MFSGRVIALLAPGQGSQTPGMFTPWLAVEGAAERVGAWSEATGLDLLRLGTTAEADEIKDTSVTQPLVVALALLAFEELRRRVSLPVDTVVAGHSVGELAAAAIAGVLSTDDAVALAAVRGAAMAAACALEPTGMAAVLGGEEEAVLARLHELGLVGANRNGAGQIVAAGPLDALDKLVENPPERAKIRRLQVAGAFHTEYMAPAEEALRARATAITAADPALPLLSNADGAVVTSGPDVLNRLISQVTHPVRWDSCQATLAARAVTAVAELPPAGTLTGLAKRELKGTPTLAVKTPDQLDALVELLEASA
ncbi:ACP S-malonyltransferase [Actinosynnema sp. NPDC023587]|uniref:ACP S-malonyltransferase n=1 Tax=Actinosynnema sp. NPDC023587 TaxID=3154695 RepID=UPI0033E5F9C8